MEHNETLHRKQDNLLLGKTNFCHRVRREGDERRVVASNLQSPVRLAVDWVSQLVFWTDDLLDVIEVADITGVKRSDHYEHM